jgi:hypothetical protein
MDDDALASARGFFNMLEANYGTQYAIEVMSEAVEDFRNADF